LAEFYNTHPAPVNTAFGGLRGGWNAPDPSIMGQKWNGLKGLQEETSKELDALIPESGVKIAISNLNRLQSVNFAEDAIGQIL
jgi:hypothetical protein